MPVEIISLAPCPWCGHEYPALKLATLTLKTGIYIKRVVTCKNDKCNAQGPIRQTDKFAAADWNKLAEHVAITNYLTRTQKPG